MPKTHGLTNTKLFKVWDSMKYRCYNENCKSYHNYGGRGISISDDWLGQNGFINFYNWAIENGYKEGLQIDRINNDGNYSPKNCRWATIKEQGNNRNTCIYITIEGITKTLFEWAEEKEITPSTLYNRYHAGMSMDELFLPVKEVRPAEKQVGIKGITWDKTKEKWRLRLRINRKIKHFGYYVDLDEAKKTRIQIIKELNLLNYD